MITTESVYNLLLDAVRKDKRGKTIDVDEFNNILPLVQAKLKNKLSKEYEKDIESSHDLSIFKIFNYQITLNNGVGELPDDYWRIVGEPRSYEDSDLRRVDFVTSIEYTQRMVDYLTQPTETHPVCFLANQATSFTTTETPAASDEVDLAIIVKPDTITDIFIDYLRTPATPFLDYYVNDTTLNYTFLDEDDTDVAVPAGSTYRDGTAGATTKNSATVDFEWDEDLLPTILGILLQTVGVQLSDPNVYQAGTIDETK